MFVNYNADKGDRRRTGRSAGAALAAGFAGIAAAALLAASLASCAQDDDVFTGIAASTMAPVAVTAIEGLPSGFARGADVSMLDRIEQCRGSFYKLDGTKADALEILKEQGVNWVRVRLWNDPTDANGNPLGGGNCDIAAATRLSARAKALGLKVLLDFHYSDTWADPDSQAKPKAWAGLSGTDRAVAGSLGKAVYDFTYASLKTLSEASALPDMVQIGNETDGGFLFPDGQISGSGGPAGMAALMNDASAAVRQAQTDFNGGNAIKIMIHLSRGGYNSLYRGFFDRIAEHSVSGSPVAATTAEVDFDVIGLSYYPYWHGPSSNAAYDLAANVADIAARYGKELVVAEVAYAWTLDYGDSYGNNFGSEADEAKGGFPATTQGQADAVRWVAATLHANAAGLDGGIFYWGGEWIPVSGAGWLVGEGDPWENQALFDFQGQLLPSAAVFGSM